MNFPKLVETYIEENVKKQYAGNIPDERVDGIVVSGHEGVLESYRKMS